ncbi:MAG: hypothetical protein AB8H79_25220 [Myxococcota bacterium]
MLTPHNLATLPRSRAHQAGSTGSVNIYFFLVIFVLALGTAGFAYHLYIDLEKKSADTKELEADVSQFEGRHNLQKDYLEKMVGALGMTGEYGGRKGVDYSGEQITSTVDPSVLRETKAAFATEVKVPNISGIEGLLVAVGDRAAGMQEQQRGTESVAAVSAKMKTLSMTATAKMKSEFASEESRLTQVVSDDASRFQAQDAARRSTAEAVNAAIRDVSGEISAEGEARATEVRELTEVANRLIGHNTSVVEKLRIRKGYDGPDGRVVADQPGVSTVVIGLGRKDSLVEGVVFRITSPGSAAVKAFGTVMSVNQETAQVKVHDVVNERNPVVRGDQVHHDLFSPNISHNVFLMGRFGYPYEGDKIKEQLSALGNRVVDEFVPGVDLVIVGQPVLNEDGDGFVAVESTEEYANALSLGVEFVKLTDVRDLFRFH